MTAQKLKARYGYIVEGIAQIFGSGCEVVLHSLEDISHSVVRIENGRITGRTEGSPITDLALTMINQTIEAKKDIIGPYYLHSEDGRDFKCIKILLRDDNMKPCGFLCVNIDLSTPISVFLKEFFPEQKEAAPVVEEHYAKGISQLVEQAVSEQFFSLNHVRGIALKDKNFQIINNLEKKGIFKIKGAIELTAQQMGITKFTVYKYLRNIRNEEAAPSARRRRRVARSGNPS